MTDGVQTRLQKDVTALQKEVQRIDVTIEQSSEQLRNEFRGSLEAVGAEMRQLFSQVMLKLGSSSSSQIPETPINVSTSRTNDSVQRIATDPKPFTKHSKLQCPRFNGEDFLGWKIKIDQFFEADETEERNKVRIAMMHFDGRALQWHQRFMKDKGTIQEVTWLCYISALKARFCDTEYADAFSALCACKQTNSVDEYFEEFEALLSLNDTSDEQALSVFLTNLKPEIEQRVRLFFPKTINHAYNLAKHVETMIYNLRRKHHLPYKQFTTLSINPLNTANTTNTTTTNTTKPALTYHNQNKTLPSTSAPKSAPLLYNKPNTRAPSRQERDERKKRGLCMWCGAKYFPGHSCVKSNLFSILKFGSDDNIPELEESLEDTTEVSTTE
ncbi:Retrotransposon gag protein [Corchorus olitorius]|uniref:Retrotransposon gag protein n=1 Tax=Corchorus olitorius TaxID=93759 RepID=A0A1R3J5H2_9ROSI|nr:Retrotransposon gag protein [Corchorus olitorius]